MLEDLLVVVVITMVETLVVGGTEVEDVITVVDPLEVCVLVVVLMLPGKVTVLLEVITVVEALSVDVGAEDVEF